MLNQSQQTIVLGFAELNKELRKLDIEVQCNGFYSKKRKTNV